MHKDNTNMFIQTDVLVGEGGTIYFCGLGVLRKVNDEKWEFFKEEVPNMKKLDNPSLIRDYFNQEEKRYTAQKQK